MLYNKRITKRDNNKKNRQDEERRAKEIDVTEKNKFVQQRQSDEDTNRTLKLLNKQDGRKPLESY